MSPSNNSFWIAKILVRTQQPSIQFSPHSSDNRIRISDTNLRITDACDFNKQPELASLQILQMRRQYQLEQLLVRLGDLPEHLLLTILPYLDHEAKASIDRNISIMEETQQRFVNLVSLSLFSETYLTAADRSMHLSLYTDPCFLYYEIQLLGQISRGNPHKYLQIGRTIENILDEFAQQLHGFLDKESLVAQLRTMVTDPEMPLPRMRKQGKGIYCNSALQFAMVDLIQESNEDDLYAEDYVIELEEALKALLPQMIPLPSHKSHQGQPLSEVLSELYYHPELITSANYSSYLQTGLVPFNLFICLHALLSTVAELYHQYISQHCNEVQQFIEFELRYCLYRGIVLAMEESGLSRAVYRGMEGLLAGLGALRGQLGEVVLESRHSEEYDRQGDEQADKPDEVRQPEEVRMDARVLAAGCKIWAKEQRRVKEINEGQGMASNYLRHSSQDSANNKSFIKILNKLALNNLLTKIDSYIQSSRSIQEQYRVAPMPQDQQIHNIFGVSAHQLGNIPTMTNHSSAGSASDSLDSPTKIGRSGIFGSKLKNSKDSNYLLLLSQVKERLKLNPYRFERPHEQIRQAQLHASPELKKLPSLRLPNRMQSKTSMQSRLTRFTYNRSVGSIEELIEANTSLEQQLLGEYHAYIVDMGVNQLNCHWCGHTQHDLRADQYRAWEQYVVKFNKGFLNYCFDVVQQAGAESTHEPNRQLRAVNTVQIMRSLLEWHLQYLDKSILPKRCINKIAKISNQWIHNICAREEVGVEDWHAVTIGFEESDKFIAHYNEQMWRIGRNVPEAKLKIYTELKYKRKPFLIEDKAHKVHAVQAEEKGQSIQNLYHIDIIHVQRKRSNSEKTLAVSPSEPL